MREINAMAAGIALISFFLALSFARDTPLGNKDFSDPLVGICIASHVAFIFSLPLPR